MKISLQSGLCVSVCQAAVLCAAQKLTVVQWEHFYISSFSEYIDFIIKISWISVLISRKKKKEKKKELYMWKIKLPVNACSVILILKEHFFLRYFLFWGNKQMPQVSDFRCLCESDAQDLFRKSTFWIWICCHILSSAALLYLTMHQDATQWKLLSLCVDIKLFIYKIGLVV